MVSTIMVSNYTWDVTLTNVVRQPTTAIPMLVVQILSVPLPVHVTPSTRAMEPVAQVKI